MQTLLIDPGFCVPLGPHGGCRFKNWALVRGENDCLLEPQLVGKQWVPRGEVVFNVGNSKGTVGGGGPDPRNLCLLSGQ